MTQTCKDCLFCEAVEDESFMACQATQKLVMPDGKVCDFFEEQGCVCEECAMPNKYINTTDLDDSCCGANSYPKLNNFGDEDYEPCDCDECTAIDYEDWTQKDFMGDDLDRAASEVLETLAFLGEGTTARDVLGSVLGLEATISLLKRYLLEYEGE